MAFKFEKCFYSNKIFFYVLQNECNIFVEYTCVTKRDERAPKQWKIMLRNLCTAPKVYCINNFQLVRLLSIKSFTKSENWAAPCTLGIYAGNENQSPLTART